eukprot:CAMPEP_0116908136 /NCGR_PEP_ID=MMETSP0467-20121206/13518_1 /TAXON_ID=283647 /ORGANISM="Mesodinium pulex, Strain SPMC105" /LENGTH=55 /DNA_ID=CAMNT_0004583281 /DNA_START=869 /DNA_END=1036 /DNA_ORIENTATION=+
MTMTDEENDNDNENTNTYNDADREQARGNIDIQAIAKNNVFNRKEQKESIGINGD